MAEGILAHVHFTNFLFCYFITVLIIVSFDMPLFLPTTLALPSAPHVILNFGNICCFCLCTGSSMLCIWNGPSLGPFFREWKAGLHLWLWEHGAERPWNRTMLRRLTERSGTERPERPRFTLPPGAHWAHVSTKFDTIHEMDKFLSPQVLQVPSGPWQTCKIGDFSAAWVIFWSVLAFPPPHCRAKKKKKIAVFVFSIQELAIRCLNMCTSACLY